MRFDIGYCWDKRGGGWLKGGKAKEGKFGWTDYINYNGMLRHSLATLDGE